MNIVMGKRVLWLGIISIWRHRLRSFLTMLGIVFGVCSVIAMLAIGEGASFEAQEQIRQMGSQNIIINSVKPPDTESASQQQARMSEYGLTYKDLERIRTTIENVTITVPERLIRSDVIYRRKRLDANAIGTVPWLLENSSLRIQRGRFFSLQEFADARNVCIISAELAERLFTIHDPIGQVIAVKGDAYQVIGIMEPAARSGESQEGSQLLTLYMPLTAAKTRLGDIIMTRTAGSMNIEKVELHRIVVAVSDENAVVSVSEVIRGLLERNRRQIDFEIVIPLELLRQAMATKRIFSIVLGSIAAISLLVGGIGIMNIMLASVTERTREIGIRRALGARQRDIVVQFMTETILLSGSGGIIGLIIGVIIPFFITFYSGMNTVIVPWSLFGALGISVLIGLIFGIYPAYRASRMNPIAALRHE